MKTFLSLLMFYVGLMLSLPLMAEDLTDPPDITILYDLPYCEGTSNAWRLDLATTARIRLSAFPP